MAQQIRDARFECFQILRTEFSLCKTAVQLECANCRDNDDRRRRQACHAALDIEEFLRAEVRAEACLCDRIITELKRGFCCENGVAAVCNIGKRTAVNKRRRAFQRLHEIRLERILQQRGHRADSVQITRCYRLFIIGICDYNARKTLLEVGDRGCEAEYRHDLRSNRDIIAVFTRYAVDSAAEAVRNITELAVIHIDAALPGNAARVNVQRIALIDVVIEHGSEQIVRSADRMEIAGEMQVDILHRDNLCIAAACRTALDAEYRSEGRFPQRNHDVLADSAHTVCKADRGRGLALTGSGRIDCRHEDELALLFGFRQLCKVDLGLISAVLLESLIGDAGCLRDLGDRAHGDGLCDLNVCKHLIFLLIFSFAAVFCSKIDNISIPYID